MTKNYQKIDKSVKYISIFYKLIVSYLIKAINYY